MLKGNVEGNIGRDLGFFIELWSGKCARLQIKVSRFESRQATLHCFLEQDTLRASASLYTGALIGTGELNAGVTL